MTTEAPDGQEHLAPLPTNASLGIEAGACVKVIATSRRTRQTSFLHLLSLSVFLSAFFQYFYLMANFVQEKLSYTKLCSAWGSCTMWNFQVFSGDQSVV